MARGRLTEGIVDEKGEIYGFDSVSVTSYAYRSVVKVMVASVRLVLDEAIATISDDMVREAGRRKR